MHIPPLLPDENSRLAALGEYAVRAGDLQHDLDRIIQLTARLFDVPMVTVSLVEREKQVFAACRGMQVQETEREISFCSHAIAQTGVFVVCDATLDFRFFDNPLVTGEPKIRFYAGAPLIDHAGYALGTLCIHDTKPRSSFTDSERRNLKDLAAVVLDHLELRRLNYLRSLTGARFQSIAKTSPDGMICLNHHGQVLFWNAAATRIFGYTALEMSGQSIDLVLPGHMRYRRSNEGLEQRGDASQKTVEMKGWRKGGVEIFAELSLSSWPADGAVSFGLIVRDISERRSHEDRLFRLAYLDELTGLPNRRVFCDRIAGAIQQSIPLSVVILDLDGFADLNDAFGRDVGDLALKEVASRLLALARPGDTVARLSGDKFGLFLAGQNDLGTARQVAGCALESVAARFCAAGESVRVRASAGVAVSTGAEHVEELLHNAGLALQEAKTQGKNCARSFTGALRDAVCKKRALEDELRRAFERQEFELFYQPQVRLNDGSLIGAEALLRWNHPVHGLRMPGEFLPALEAARLSAQVGNWAIQQACSQLSRWRALAPSGFRVAVNLFEAQLRNGDLASIVRAYLASETIEPFMLELEITENIILWNDETMIGPLRELHSAGVGIAFDDYGMGYASLSLLKTYPLTRLKIDRSFTQHMCGSPQDASVIHAILHLARGFGLGVVAEGVETRQQSARLHRKGVVEAQGYLFGKPMPARDFSARFGLLPGAPSGQTGAAFSENLQSLRGSLKQHEPLSVS